MYKLNMQNKKMSSLPLVSALITYFSLDLSSKFLLQYSSLDPNTGIRFKDVIISPENNVSARLYLPPPPPAAVSGQQKFPLLVYFHGGKFNSGSAFSSLIHNHLISIVAKADVVAVSVNYRLAPEFPLPIGYEDSWLALKWALSTNEEYWIKEYADLGRVYLGGDSAGGNIAHNVAIRAGSEKAVVTGLFLDSPLFCGEEPLVEEERDVCQLWRYVCPSSTGCDDPLINPATDPKLSGLGCKRVLMFVGDRDFMRERVWCYKEALSKSGWGGDIEIVQVKGEDHCFSILQPHSPNTAEMIEKLAAFLNH